MTVKVKAFISFDYDNDLDLKNNLIAQSRNQDTLLKIDDVSIQEPIINEKWKKRAREIIKKCDIVIFICGKHTDQAKGVSAEMTITNELKKPYILLKGRRRVTVQKPQGALSSDEIVSWNWKRLSKSVLEKIKNRS